MIPFEAMFKSVTLSVSRGRFQRCKRKTETLNVEVAKDLKKT